MIFEETNCDTFIPAGECLVYFLLDNGEVVYVGQTTQGIMRPLSHKDKVYDTIKIMYCDQRDLLILEDKFISKYCPKYNKTINSAFLYNLSKARNKIREKFEMYSFNQNDLKAIMKKLNIQLAVFNFKAYIRYPDFEKIVDYISKGKFHNITEENNEQ